MEASVRYPPFEPPRTLHPAKVVLIGRSGLSSLRRHLTSTREEQSGNSPSLELEPCDVEERESTNDKVDLIIGLDAHSLRFEARLRPEGTLLLNEVGAEARPRRRDIHTIIVPAKALARACMNGVGREAARQVSEAELEEAVMIGAARALEDFDQITQELSELPEASNPAHRSALALAMCKGYDWIQERKLHCKSIEVGA